VQILGDSLFLTGKKKGIWELEEPQTWKTQIRAGDAEPEASLTIGGRTAAVFQGKREIRRFRNVHEERQTSTARVTYMSIHG